MKLSLRRDKSEKKKKKSKAREWLDAGVFAIIAATLIRWLLFEPFTIPTPSMERSLMVGDFLFVSKLHYGPMTPKTPIQFPFAHQTFWGTNIKSYSSAIQLPRYRLPHFSSVKKGDAVVFHYPDEKNHPTDMRVHYIKRCIAIAGDTLTIDQGQVFINGQRQEDRAGTQYRYLFQTKDNKVLYNNFFDRQNLVPGSDIMATQSPGQYTVFLTQNMAEEFNNLPITANLERLIDAANDTRSSGQTYPDTKNNGALFASHCEQVNPSAQAFGWNKDNFGPLWMPQEGATITMTAENVAKYGYVIKHYEGFDPEDVTLGADYVEVEGEKLTEYTFTQDYFWMMGDNRDNSLDSRFWGFVPDDHVVGKAAFVWLSVDKNKGGLRFERMFRSVKNL